MEFGQGEADDSEDKGEKTIRNCSKLETKRTFEMKEGLKGLVCLNCTSYMCGLRDVWMTSCSTDESLKDLRLRQEFDDGKIEFMAFNNELTLAL
jgi:hypothetical protein